MDKWDGRFLDAAALVASWSKDPSTRVGCVIVNERRHIVATGYNGFPKGVEDSVERLNDRPTKYLMVQHAEVNALLQAETSIRGTTAYVTHQPCANCTGAMIQAGIKRIVTYRADPGLAERFEASFNASAVMLEDAGVEIEFVDQIA